MPSSASATLAPPPTVSKKSTYLPQLDGLRGIAILSVLLHHFDFPLPDALNWGPIGVRIFFLLSGYLITLSVWKLKSPSEMGRKYWWDLRAFHLRRMTRLTPVLYMMLIMGVLMGLAEYRDGFLWHAAFLSNFYVLHHGDWPGAASHLWSLSVQEQFYLIWPFVILMVPRRWLGWALLGMFVSAAAYRITLMALDSSLYMEASTFYRWVLFPGVMDSFALGALIAVWKKAGGKIPLATGKSGVAIMLAAIASYLTAYHLRRVDFAAPWLGVTETLENLFLGWLLLRTIEGWPGVLGRMFENRILVYIGRISYGLYVFHVLVNVAVGPWLSRMGLSLEGHAVIHTAILILLSMGIATLSYRYIEMPLSAWVRRREKAALKSSVPVAPSVG